MRTLITAGAAATAGLTGASVLGVATAEAPTTTQLRTVSVEGVASETIERAASAATATAVYHRGMLDAVTDGQGKAQLLAGRVGATLGPVQSLVEGGGYIACSNLGEPSYAEYEGAQPDFGSPVVGVGGAPVSAGTTAPRSVARPRKPAVKRGRRRTRPVAKKAVLTSCTLSARVSVVYTIG
jgi:hypothetical protein